MMTILRFFSERFIVQRRMLNISYFPCNFPTPRKNVNTCYQPYVYEAIAMDFEVRSAYIW